MNILGLQALNTDPQGGFLGQSGRDDRRGERFQLSLVLPIGDLQVVGARPELEALLTIILRRALHAARQHLGTKVQIDLRYVHIKPTNIDRRGKGQRTTKIRRIKTFAAIQQHVCQRLRIDPVQHDLKRRRPGYRHFHLLKRLLHGLQRRRQRDAAVPGTIAILNGGGQRKGAEFALGRRNNLFPAFPVELKFDLQTVETADQGRFRRKPFLHLSFIQQQAAEPIGQGQKHLTAHGACWHR